MSDKRNRTRTQTRRSSQPDEEEEDEDDELRAENIPRNASWSWIAAFFAILTLIIIVVAIFSKPQNKKKSAAFGESVGGSAAYTSGIYFVHPYELNLAFLAMQNITNTCSPPTFPTPDPIYNILQTGTYASTLASWAALKALVSGTGPNQCIFYGIMEMELLTGLAEGPADICQGYMSAGLQYFAVNNFTQAQTANFLNYIQLAVLSAYPLNLYWRNSLGSLNWDINLANQINTLVLAFLNPSSPASARDIQSIAMSFCNPYFASDIPDYTNPTLLTQLSFPWEGLIARQSHTLMATAFQNAIGYMGPTPGSNMSAIYIIDPGGVNGLENNTLVQLFLANVAPTPAPVVLTTVSVADALAAIAQSMFLSAGSNIINPAAVPVMIIGRYVDSMQAYQSFQIPAGTTYIMLSNDDPNNLLHGQDLGTVLQNAAASGSMSVLDLQIEQAFEYSLGPAFHPQKAVSDFVNLVIGTTVQAGSTAALGLLPTFAMAFTLVAGVDIGGRYDGELMIVELEAGGVSTGYKFHSFAMQLTETVANVTANTSDISFGGGTPPGTLPSKFSWRTQMPQCLPPVINQGSCNDCWAISTTHAMSARLCIASGGTTPASQFLSLQQVVACSTNLITNTDGCDAQYPSTAFTFMMGDVTTTQCMPAVFTGTKAGGCPAQCTNGVQPPFAGGILGGSYASLQTPKDIKASLIADGPLAIGIGLPTDFYQFFRSNVPQAQIYPLTPQTKFAAGEGHMMMLTGFDDTTSPPSWEIQNSWSEQCGVNGYIYLAQDVNGYLKNRGPWVDYNGYIAKPRTTPTSPNAVLSKVTTLVNTNGQAKPGTLPSVYTASVSCPNMVLNRNQSSASAAIQGCPNSAAEFQRSSSRQTSPATMIAAATYATQVLVPTVVSAFMIM